MYRHLAFLAVFILVYNATAGRLENLPVSGAILALVLFTDVAQADLKVLKISLVVPRFSLLMGDFSCIRIG